MTSKTHLFTAFLALLVSFNSLSAHEGMWLPHLLKMMEGDMQAMGMKMSADDIYAVNQSSLKDAILRFGGGCTASIISDQGLVLTNHHCGYGYIQSHSSVESNLLRDGFWAKTKAEEIPNPGLSVMMIRRIEDVTESILEGVTTEMSEQERQSIIDRNTDAYQKTLDLGPHEDSFVRAIYYGNQYLLFVTVTYRDIRLVGTPPESIGKFGSDTDNWEWPRHTGDFALFRIYAGPENEPADFAENNQPYQPDYHLPVSLDGVAEGDFTLVFGFPGRTQQYLPASAVHMIQNEVNPPRIAVRDAALKILDKAMRADEATRIQYASKYARIANYWKKWIGESQGLAQTDAVWKKRSAEMEFRERVDGDPRYEGVLDRLDSLYLALTPYEVATQYHSEVVQRNIEIFTVARLMSNLAERYDNGGEAAFTAYKERLVPYLERFYKDYRWDLDTEVFATLFDMLIRASDPRWIPEALPREFGNGQAGSRAAALMAQSRLPQAEKAMPLLEGDPADVVAAVKADSLVIWYRLLNDTYTERVGKPRSALLAEINQAMRTYMAAQMAVFDEQAFYPDANSTLRVTFGKAEGYTPNDSTTHTHQTWLDGVMAKYVPGDYEFDVPERLRDLHAAKDYGPYAEEGKMPVCFLGSNHTTGGNSGSPVMDAEGNLIGLNFDRVWEGTMSDLNFDPRICRNIMVDARYILFIVDKFAGAKHLVDELTTVHPKKG